MTPQDHSPNDPQREDPTPRPEGAPARPEEPTRPPTSEAPEPEPRAGSTGGGGPQPPRRLTRSREDRVIGGLCAGVARYFGVDPLIMRIAAVALVFVGGVGPLLYLAGLLLVPDEATGPVADTTTTRGRLLTALGVIALVAAGAVILSGAALFLAELLVPLAVLAFVGLAVWWIASGEGLGGSTGDILRRMALGLAVLAVCGVIAAGGFWAAAAGGGTVAAALVIAAGVALVVGAFVGRARWLVLPALALALPVAFVSAAGIELDGGYGEREYRPGSAMEVRDRYEVGAGRLVIDLRNAALPAGDRALELDVGMGEAVLVVPENVCVATRARIGMGAVEVFDRENEGVDLDWEDRRRAAVGTTRLLVDADIGLGALQVSHRDLDGFGDDHRFDDDDRGFGDDDDGDDDDEDADGDDAEDAGNGACTEASTAGDEALARRR